MSKKIVLSVMVIDDEDPKAKPEFFENVSLEPSTATEALPQIQQWISEKFICAKMSGLTKVDCDGVGDNNGFFETKG